MAKGSGGGGGSRNSGGAGGRSATNKQGVMRDLAIGLGLELFVMSAAAGLVLAADKRARQTTSYEAKRLGHKAFRKAVNATAKVTGSMRDRVRAWAERKAGEEATKAARAANPGAINTDGIAMHAIRGVLGNGKMSDPIPTGSKSKFSRIPDKSYLKFKKGGNIYAGADIKTLARDAIASGNWSFQQPKK